MRWTSKPLPKNHERRIIRKFALLPKRMADSGVTIWFGRYWRCQDWLMRSEGDGGWWNDKGNVEDVRVAKAWKVDERAGFIGTVHHFLAETRR